MGMDWVVAYDRVLCKKKPLADKSSWLNMPLWAKSEDVIHISDDNNEGNLSVEGYNEC